MRSAKFLSVSALVALACAIGVPTSRAEPPAGLSADDAKQIERDVRELGDRLATMRKKPLSPEREDLVADAEIFLKGIIWALKYETKLEPNDIALIKKAIDRCAERFSEVGPNKPSWAERKGKLVRGYVSVVDGSVQPFGLIIPANYDPTKPTRLDVVLHGSSKPIGLSELRFMNRFDEGDGPAKNAPDTNYIELHPL